MDYLALRLDFESATTNRPLAASLWNGLRIPSIADELATERRTLRSRTAGSRMYLFALASVSVI